MPGDVTRNFDLVMEFSERALNELFGSAFDSSGFLCSILTEIGAGSLCDEVFRVDVLMDRPTDISISASERDILDIRLTLGDDGDLGSLRMVVGVDVDRGSSGFDIIRINFTDRLFATEASLVGIPVSTSLFEDVLRNNVRQIPLMPVPVDRATDEATELMRADTAIIDDNSAADRDAWAVMLTFGGGTIGDPNDFTSGFVPVGGRGAIAIFFDWLCRVIGQGLEDDPFLNLPDGAFTDCRLNQTIRIDEGEEVDLTRLELTLEEDNVIGIIAQVKKSGFCYEATGTMRARISFGIEEGQLVVQSEVDDPDIDTDIPIICWITGAAIGLLLGGILGAIVGGFLVPLIVHLSTEVVEGTIENIMESLADTINALSPDVNVPALGIRIVFQDVFIDDIVIKCLVEPIDRVPIRSEGTLLVKNGQFIDLDSGKVGDDSLPGADLQWQSSFFFGQLRTVCNVALARTGWKAFESMTRYKLYHFFYQSPLSIPSSELATQNPFSILLGDPYKEKLFVYGVRTDEGRYAAVRVIEVDDEFIRLQYKTYEKFMPTLQLVGGFECRRPILAPKEKTVHFKPILGQRRPPSPATIKGAESALEPRREKEVDFTKSADRMSESLMQANLAALPRDLVERSLYKETPLASRRVGRWQADLYLPTSDFGRFDAVVNGLRPPLTFNWELEGQRLEEGQGEKTFENVTMGYTLEGGRLILRPQKAPEIEFELKVTVTDNEETSLTTSRCVRYKPICNRQIRYIPDWKTYQVAHLQYFGIVEVPSKM